MDAPRATQRRARDLHQRWLLRNAFAQRESRGTELVAVPVVAGLLGYGLDRWIGTMPLLTIVLVVLALAAQVVKLYYGYEEEMRKHEADAPWKLQRRGVASHPDQHGGKAA